MKPTIAINALHMGSQKLGTAVYAAGIMYGISKSQPAFSMADFTYYLPQDFTNDLDFKSKVKIKKLPVNSYSSIKRIFVENLMLPLSVNKSKPDIFHSTSFTLPNFINSKIKKIVSVPDMIFYKYPQYFSPARRRYYKYSFKKAILKSDLLIAISESTKNDIVKYLNIPRDKIQVCYPGILNDSFTPDKDIKTAVKHKFNLPDKFVLCVGKIETRKNITLVGEALKKLKDKHGIEVPLVLVGKIGWEGDAILTSLKKNCPDLLFLKYVDDSDLRYLYNLATILLYPSLYEGFGLPILEAMVCGAPVIASATSSLPEVGGEASILLSPDDPDKWAESIYSIITDENLRQTLIDKGFNQAKMFSLEKVTDKLINIYKSVL